MNRRSFIASLGTMVILASLPACWIRGGIFDQITEYIRVALVAFDRIVAILIEHAVNVEKLAQSIVVVKAALADILAAIEAFRGAHEQNKATLIAAIKAALQIASDRLREFWRTVAPPGPELQSVKLLLDVIITTLDGYAARLGAPPPGGKRLLGQPSPRTLKEFRRDFNQILEMNGESKFAL